MTNFKISAEDVASVTDAELAFGTIRLLPKEEDIPKQFWDGNFYTKLASAIFYNTELPSGRIVFNEGFNKDSIVKAVRAHLRSFEPHHEHKIAGVGYLIACVSQCFEIDN